jgi:ADP-ribose pyrophosphatase YjhB (NUDIX family)
MIDREEQEQYMKAATLICLRLSPHRNRLTTPSLISQCSSSASTSPLQVLLGQNETINWLKSTSSQNLVPMRYPGEWKFPGGVYDPDLDDALESTAIRELREEFLGLNCPPNEILRSQMKLFNQKFTLPVQGRRYEMNNFLFILKNDGEGLVSWDEDEIARVNQNLSQKKNQFLEKMSRNEYWELSYEQRLPISPEVYQVQWVDLDEAISLMESSLTHHDWQIEEEKEEEGTRKERKYVNVWQQEQFEQYGILRRDPMYQSMMILREIRDSMREEK